jgi:hypothetical protein
MQITLYTPYLLKMLVINLMIKPTATAMPRNGRHVINK